MLDNLKRRAFEYFRHHWNPANGLIADKNQPGSPASIAVLGMGLTAYAVASECGLMSRSEAVARTLVAFFTYALNGPGH